MKAADDRLKSVDQALDRTIAASNKLGDTSATVARRYDKLNDGLRLQRQRLTEAGAAYQAGTINARQFATIVTSVGTQTASLSGRIKDANARIAELGEQGLTHFQQLIKGATGGGAAVTAATEKIIKAMLQQKQIATQASQSFQNGKITAEQYSAVINQTDARIMQLNRDLVLTQQRMNGVKGSVANAGSVFKSVFAGTAAAFGVSSFGLMAKSFAEDSIRLFGTLDKLTRFTATLDKSFQTPENLRKFRDDIKQLSTEIPHSAESIAKASFTLKSAFQNITEPELIVFLREFGEAATASNTDIAAHAENVAALAKQYGFSAKDINQFSALIASSFGQALASDQKVAEGFNRILNSAKSIRQPIDDMVAAMSTLQSASSDAEMNTTLLLNVYSKLTDQKYIEGIKSIGVSVFDASGNFRSLNSLINDMAKELSGLSDEQINEKLSFAKDQQAREGLKTLIRLVGDYNKQLQTGADQEAFKAKNELMLNSVEARWAKFVNKIDGYKQTLGALFVDIVDKDWKSMVTDAREAGFMFGADWGKGVREAVLRSVEVAKHDAHIGGDKIGDQLALGFIAGMQGNMGGVEAAARSLALSAYTAAVQALMIHSPSKLFYGLGENVVQGYIDGINSLKASAQTAMAKLLDISGLKKFGKGDTGGVELLTQLVGELAKANVASKAEEVMLQLTAKAYEKLNPLIKERILLAAQEIDKLSAVKDAQSLFTEIIDKAFPKTEFEINQLKIKELALKGVNEQMVRQLNLLNRVTGIKDVSATGEGGTQRDPFVIGEGTNTRGLTAVEQKLQDIADEARNAAEDLTLITVPPPPIDYWADFWGMMKREITSFGNSLPSIKEAIGVNLVSAIEGIGDVFGRAVAQWDGTAKGFFKSIAQGFQQLVQSIISELIRLMVIKLITNIIGSIAGGGFGGGGGGASHGGPDLGASTSIGGHAEGGYVRGPGTSMSDSILKRLSDGEFVIKAKTVRKWGVGFFEQLNAGMRMPRMAFADGGYSSAGSSPGSTGSGAYDYSTNAQTNHYHINITGGSNPQQTAMSVKQAIREMSVKQAKEIKRNS